MDSIVTTEDTIAAIASAISIGKGGVAIIRVSGKDAINSCKKIVQTKSKYAWESHRVFHGFIQENKQNKFCLLYTSPSPRDRQKSRMPSSA